MNPLVSKTKKNFSFCYYLLFIFLFNINTLYASSNELSDSTKLNQKKFFQKFNKKYTYNYGILSQLYPIRDNPTVGYRSSYRKDETIIVDVHPILSLSFYNDFKEKLKAGKFFSQGYAVNFRPQFRLYSELSTPVKMPSYNVTLSVQNLFRLSQKHLISYALESGHYSNGQSGSSLTCAGDDQSAISDSMWASITPETNLSDIINRKNGDFSTNFTELIFNYRFIPKFDKFNMPKQVHSFSTGFVYYHNRLLGMINVGGYTDESIKIYGKWRFLFSYEYNYNLKSGFRVHVSESLKIIAGAHPSVNPVRSVLQTTFFLPQSLGIFVSYIYGHDDYNLRFVDSGHQIGVGLTWDVFPPIPIGKDKKLLKKD